MSFLSNMWSLEAEPLDPDTASRMADLVERLAAEVVRRRMVTPALVVLESARPLAYAGSQALVFLEPLVRTLLSAPDYDLFVKLLEDRDRVEGLIAAIEAKDGTP